jgi:Zn-finger nucleic acid-binding protein
VCKKQLEAYRDGPGAIFDCGLCGGQFVEHALLRQMVEHRAHAAPDVGPTPRSLWRPETRTGYIPCPTCAALMNRKNYGGVSGVIVDICKRHGVWFDLGELPRVLAFVDAGGLERAKQRAEEEAAQQRRDTVAAAAAAAAQQPRLSAGVLGHADTGVSITELLAHLFTH